MMDEPTAPELLDVVALLLRNDIMPEMTGYRQYQVRVAANVIEILSRQWVRQSAADEREHELLAALLGSDGSLAELNAQLCHRIAQREMTIGTPGLTDALWSSVMDRLAIDQPRYSAHIEEMRADR